MICLSSLGDPRTPVLCWSCLVAVLCRSCDVMNGVSEKQDYLHDLCAPVRATVVMCMSVDD
jgi:hypothetical protein